MAEQYEGKSKHGFSQALENAALKHGAKLGNTVRIVEMEADIEHHSPGHITEYRVKIERK